MATTEQINANRQNAQKSTGPKTDEGKATASKNAVKHGLFAAEAVIEGENQADYEAYLDNFLAELQPVGMVETMMAARFVCLSWRLKRAERMHNQAIDKMIEYEVTSPLARQSRKLMCHAQGIPLGDKRYTPGHLPLGRIAWKDFADGRVLDRLILYERRIENSMLRMLREFKKQQIMKQIIQQDQAIPNPMNDNRDEAATRFGLNDIDLKKQSQFVPGMMGVNPIMEGGYGDMSMFGTGVNKANPPEISMPTRNRRTSQSQFDAPFSPERVPETDKPPTAATG
jgi:hypothetical protein